MKKNDVAVNPQITLASASPRRRELLNQICITYHVLPVNIDESYIAGESAEQFVSRLALEKAQAGYQLAPQRAALGADTIVVCDNKILGKPEDKEHGLSMLKQLSAKTHQVITAVAICTTETEHCILSCSEVEFAELNTQQIEAYWETGEPVDKAGGYGVQGIAAQFIKNIKGSYSGIMGLPLYETAELLKLVNISVLKK